MNKKEKNVSKLIALITTIVLVFAAGTFTAGTKKESEKPNSHSLIEVVKYLENKW